MVNEIVVPVLTGLVLGIALIVVAAIYAKPTFIMTDDEILEKARSLPEVQALRERYGTLEQIGREGTTSYVYYQIGRSWPGDENSEIETRKALYITVRIDPFGRTEVWYECGGAISVSGPATVELIKTTDCIERL